MTHYHTPALLDETIEALHIDPNGIYVDVTFGGGGHSRVILSHLEQGKLFAFDQDTDAINNLLDHPNFYFAHHNFRYLKHFLHYSDIHQIDGLLADLGVSSHHFDEADRGFSTRFEGPLDMRMNTSSSLTAADVLNNYEEYELRKIFKLYGELDQAARLAKTIVNSRKNKAFDTINDFKERIDSVVPKNKEVKFYAKVFQALRIEVNQEMETLKEMLEQSAELIKPGGRLVVITYHSLEDRIVKNFMKSGNFEGVLDTDLYGNVSAPFSPLNKKPIVPSQAEIERNNRSRSAKLRIGVRNDD